MNREPLGLYIFRFLMGFGLFAFMAMLYWSSALLEKDMKQVQSQLEQINGKIAELKTNGVAQHDQKPVEAKKEVAYAHADLSLPNLLTEDPFFEKTLPDMLGSGFQPHGTLRSATIGKPDNLHPFSQWGVVMGWIGICNVNVSQSLFGKYKTFGPDMATRMELRQNSQGEPEYWIFLRDGVYWHPLQKSYFSQDIKLAPMFFQKHQVTAHDFKLFFDAVMNPFVQDGGAIALRTYLRDIEELKVIDDLTFTVRWKTKEFPDGLRMKYIAKIWTGGLQPLASFVYKYFPDGRKIVEEDSDPETYRTNSVWAQNLSQHWAKNIIPSCGPWIFDGMTDREIRFKRNPDHYQPFAALAKANSIAIKQTPEAVWQDFKAGMIDYYNILPTQLVELDNFLKSSQYKDQEAKGQAINRLDYVARQYSFVGWNQARPYFTSNKVRRALTMAIDRARIIRQNLNGMGIETNGTFFRFSRAYDESILPWPYDPTQARLLLEEEGWYDSDGDGIIDKEINGKRVPFRFSLIYYVKNPQTKAICEYISTALKEMGIDCQSERRGHGRSFCRDG